MRDSFQVTRAELANMMAVLQDEEARAGTVATAESTNPSEEYYSTIESANFGSWINDTAWNSQTTTVHATRTQDCAGNSQNRGVQKDTG